MFKRFFMVSIIALCLTPLTSFATITSKDLLDYCTTYVQIRENLYKGTPDNEAGIETGICLAYIVGIINMDSLVAESSTKEGETAKGGWALCLPDDITGDQSADAVLKYLHDNPNEVNTSTAVMVVKALRAAYPCASSTSTSSTQ
ncbi:MAG: Rap1a/Tai family immunity protein [Gammaproteobacteria bacterium]